MSQHQLLTVKLLVELLQTPFLVSFHAWFLPN